MRAYKFNSIIANDFIHYAWNTGKFSNCRFRYSAKLKIYNKWDSENFLLGVYTHTHSFPIYQQIFRWSDDFLHKIIQCGFRLFFDIRSSLPPFSVPVNRKRNGVWTWWKRWQPFKMTPRPRPSRFSQRQDLCTEYFYVCECSSRTFCGVFLFLKMGISEYFDNFRISYNSPLSSFVYSVRQQAYLFWHFTNDLTFKLFSNGMETKLQFESFKFG